MNSEFSVNGFTDWLTNTCIEYRRITFLSIILVTIVFGYFAVQIPVITRFQDLLPEHPFMEVHNEYKENFGGGTTVSILLEVNGDGTVFQRPILKKIQTITRDLRKVEAVNPGSIMSLASKRVTEVYATARRIKTEPLMWPEVPKSEEAIQDLQKTARSNPQVYGVYVSNDLKAARISTDFYPRLLNPVKAFDQIGDLTDRVDDEQVDLSMVGGPVLYGWVFYYLTQTVVIAVVTFVLIGLVLLVFTGSLMGSLIGLLITVVSTCWALGFSQMIGLHFDPLVVVIAFLIVARGVSACVQSLMRYKQELRSGVEDTVLAAKRTLGAKWTPGVLAVVTDAGAFFIVYLTPIPILQKIALIGFVWLITKPITSIILTNVSLSLLGDIEHGSLIPVSFDQYLKPISRGLEWMTLSRGRYVVLALTFIVILGAGYYATGVTIGNAKPGSSILWTDSQYNRSVRKLNDLFLGSNQMFVVFEGKERGALRKPAVLNQMKHFQRFVESQPEIGGSLSLADALTPVNQTLHEGDPRYLYLPDTERAVSELIYFFRDAPEALAGLSDPTLKNGAVTLFFKDRQGETIESAMNRIQSYKHRMEQNNSLELADLKLAGGRIGVLAATNQAIEATELESIAEALLLAIILCALTYWTPLAGLYLIIPLILANAVTYGYMSWADIGLNINSVPVAALGIGLGIDYAIYVADRIRTGYEETGDIREAIQIGYSGAGRSVIITVIILAVSIVPFLFSSLRFQAEMALLIAVWMTVAAIGGVLVIPALIRIFKPQFIVGGGKKESKPGETPSIDS